MAQAKYRRYRVMFDGNEYLVRADTKEFVRETGQVIFYLDRKTEMVVPQTALVQCVEGEFLAQDKLKEILEDLRLKYRELSYLSEDPSLNEDARKHCKVSSNFYYQHAKELEQFISKNFNLPEQYE